MHRTTALLGAGAALLLMPAAASAAETAPIYKVAQEGLTSAEGARLAETFKVPNALRADGSFGYVSPGFADVPLRRLGVGKDESGRPIVRQAIDTAALAKLRPLAAAEALERSNRLVQIAGLSPDMKAIPTVSHSRLTLSDKLGRATSQRALDTSVSFAFRLGDLPVTGQGSKLRITFDGAGRATQLSHSLRRLERSDDVPIIPVEEAQKACTKLYARGVVQRTPTLGYLLPALGAKAASGQGSVQAIYPHYTCNPATKSGNQAHRQVPAVEGAGPKAVITAKRSGNNILAGVDAGGGSGPYTFRWSSSTTALPATSTQKLAYVRRARAGLAETLTLEVTDANGLTATASAALPVNGSATAQSAPGGGGFGKLAIGPVDVGIEQTVDEWQCAQDSAIGFKAVMASRGIATAFDFRGWSAWERDFKDVSKGGTDTTYVDNVDAQWYTGHGSPGGFTFKSSVSDTSIVPGDALWGNHDLEWLQLESCQVLADTNGTHNYFSRWGGTMDGLHMLNGFHTNAYCVGGGTGRRFAEYLFPAPGRAALTVRRAWAQMALDKEPGGVVYRSMGNIGAGWVTNIGDHMWGQGPVGPDIRKAGRIGMWSITGTV